MASRLFFCALLALAACASAPEAPPPGGRWYDIVADDGERLGYASRHEAADGGARTITERQFYYLREHNSQPTRIANVTIRWVGSDGQTDRIEETTSTGRFTSRTSVRRDGARADVQRVTRTETREEMVSLPAGVVLDDGEALLAAWDVSASPRLEFLSFNVNSASVERVVIEATQAGADGRVAAIRRRYEGADLRGVSRILLGADGHIIEAAQPVFGETIWFRESSRERVLEAHSPYAVVSNSMVRSPVRITSDAQRGHIRYRLYYRDGFDFALPSTGEQRQLRDGDAVVVDVCETCGEGLASDPNALSAALRPTAWLQSDDSRIIAIAAPVARMNVSDARKMELLIERALPYIAELDFNGHYSALDTVIRRAGDCTEAAVLLAALGRAAGIPTRVASGVTYSRQAYHGVSNAFMPHSWTLAYVDGRWRSFDLALAEFSSTHIALTIGDGDPRSIAAAGQLASLLVFDSLAEVRTRR